jgi:uncharacterized protein (DUF488 family)
LLDAYKGGLIDWQKYKEEYTYQIGFGEHTQEVWKAMILIKKYLDKGIDVTVYCHEADWEHCHRNILGKLFKPMDYNVSEIGER